MKLFNFIKLTAIFLTICLMPASGFAEDTNIIFKHDQTGVADEVNKMKDFDFELQKRDRDRMKEWDIKDSVDAMNVGDVYYNKDEIADAIHFYQIAIKINPANKEAHEKYIMARDKGKKESIEAMQTGDVYYNKGEIDDAIHYYQIAIEIDPANAEAHAKYIDARNIEKEKTPSHYHQAMEYYRKGMKKKAIDELIIEIKENPDNEEARIKLNEIESQ